VPAVNGMAAFADDALEAEQARPPCWAAADPIQSSIGGDTAVMLSVYLAERRRQWRASAGAATQQRSGK